MCGRLVCDIKISAKELIRAKSYDLGPLVTQVLRVKENEHVQYSLEEVKKCYGYVTNVTRIVRLFVVRD